MEKGRQAAAAAAVRVTVRGQRQCWCAGSGDVPYARQANGCGCFSCSSTLGMTPPNTISLKLTHPYSFTPPPPLHHHPTH